jgi:hypothetical protein
MESVGDAKPWTIDRERRAYGLRVVLPKRTYVLPWAQFLYAEGAPDTVRAVFSMHDVIVTGCGLEALLADFAASRHPVTAAAAGRDILARVRPTRLGRGGPPD